MIDKVLLTTDRSADHGCSDNMGLLPNAEQEGKMGFMESKIDRNCSIFHLKGKCICKIHEVCYFRLEWRFLLAAL